MQKERKKDRENECRWLNISRLERLCEVWIRFEVISACIDISAYKYNISGCELSAFRLTDPSRLPTNAAHGITRHFPLTSTARCCVKSVRTWKWPWTPTPKSSTRCTCFSWRSCWASQRRIVKSRDHDNNVSPQTPTPTPTHVIWYHVETRNEWINEWMNEWINGWMNEWMNKWIK